MHQQLLSAQAQLIAHTQSILSDALHSGDSVAAVEIATVLEKLTSGYAHLSPKQSTVASSLVGNRPASGWTSSARQPQQVQQQRRPSLPPSPPEPQRYVYNDGFAGVELPLDADQGNPNSASDRDELPPGDYWQ